MESIITLTFLVATFISADNSYKQFGSRSGPTFVGPDLDPNCFDTDRQCS